MILDAWLYPALFVVAVLYSSVGHGGASGYLAVLSFTALASREVAVLALVTNVLVAGVSFVAYRSAKHFDLGLVWPFAVASIPLAFVGASLKLPPGAYYWAVAVVLVLAAWRLVLPDRAREPRPLPGMGARLGMGGVMGFASGIVGVGGGIFLSPVLILTGWANAKRAGAASAAFIVVNSAAGLIPRSGDLAMLQPHDGGLVASAVAGSLVGSWLGTRKLGLGALRQVLAVVLVFAAVKLAMKAAGAG
ncbi:MAG: hypothetical protein AMXMBFR81_02820 [Chthonomonas sp.]